MPKFANNIDLQQNELQNARVHNKPSPPDNPVEGQLYFNSSNGIKHAYIYTGVARGWQLIEGYQPASAFLDVLDAIGNGLMTKLSSGSAIARVLTGGAGIVITNGDGVGGQPTIALQSGVMTPGTYKKVTVDQYGRVTNGDVLSSTDIPQLPYTKIDNFDAQVRTSRLDQMATPQYDVAMGGKKITGLSDPQNLQDAATKGYVDNAIQGLNAKASVRLATTANVNFGALPSALDGKTLAQGDRILVKDQTTQSQNGIYIVDIGGWTRAEDATPFSELVAAYVWVREGNTQADTGWLCTALPGGTLGTTALPWVQFSGAGQIIVGYGLSKSGNTINLVTGDGINDPGVDGNISIALETNSGLSVGSGKLGVGAGTGISVLGGQVSVTNPKVKWDGYCGSPGKTWTINHNLNITGGTIVMLYEGSNQVFADVTITNSNTVTINFATAPTFNQYYAVILG